MWLQDCSFTLVSSFVSLSANVDGVPAGPGSTVQADESRNKVPSGGTVTTVWGSPRCVTTFPYMGNGDEV